MNTLQDYCNHSGGAIGSDTEWDIIGSTFGMVNNKHYWHGTKTPRGNTEISKEQLEEGWSRVLLANRKLCRQPEKYKNLLSRNWMQVKNSSAVFAIAKVDSFTQVKGGTGWAVQMAIDAGKVVYVFDLYREEWCEFSYEQWCFFHCEVPVLTKHFAGIGTREINDVGRKAIKDVYLKTIKIKSNEHI